MEQRTHRTTNTDELERGWNAVSALHSTVDTLLEKALQSEAGMSVVEYRTLEAVSQSEDNHLRVQDVAQRTCLSVSATTRLINRLEDRGLAARQLCDDDRRGIYIELTDDGNAALLGARSAHREALAAAMETLGLKFDFASWVSGLKDVQVVTEAR